MSWLSSVAGDLYDSVTNDIDSQSHKLIGDKKTADRVSRFGRRSVAMSGGRITSQYDYSRRKGMDEDEAAKNTYFGGATYQQARGEQKERVAEEDAQVALNRENERIATIERQEARKHYLEQGIRSRRAKRADGPSNKGGTLLTGTLGIPSSGSATAGTLLGR